MARQRGDDPKNELEKEGNGGEQPAMEPQRRDSDKLKRWKPNLRLATKYDANDAMEEFIVEANVFAFDDPQTDPTTYFSKGIEFLVERKEKRLIIKFLLKYDIWRGENPWTYEKVKEFLRWIKGIRLEWLEATDTSKQNTFIVALVEDRDFFVRAILEIGDMQGIITKKSDISGTCLHVAITTKSKFTLELMEIGLKKDLLPVQDRDGNNLLHILTESVGEEMDHFSLEARLDLLKKIISSRFGLEMLQQKNHNDRTPYQLREDTLETHFNDQHAPERVESARDATDRTPQGARSGTSNIKNIEDRPGVLLRKIIIADPVANYIRLHCIRSLDETDAIMNALYRSGNG